MHGAAAGTSSSGGAEGCVLLPLGPLPPRLRVVRLGLVARLPAPAHASAAALGLGGAGQRLAEQQQQQQLAPSAPAGAAGAWDAAGLARGRQPAAQDADLRELRAVVAQADALQPAGVSVAVSVQVLPCAARRSSAARSASRQPTGSLSTAADGGAGTSA